MWQRKVGGERNDYGYDVAVTEDGQSHVVVGKSASFGAEQTDVYVFESDSEGNVSWQRTFGGMGSNGGLDIQSARDGGFVVVGYSNRRGISSVYLVRLDKVGGLMWEKRLAGSGREIGYSVQELTSGFLVMGQSNDTSMNTCLILTNPQGVFRGKATVVGRAGFDIVDSSEGSYVIAGRAGALDDGFAMEVIVREGPGQPFVRGDSNTDGAVNLSDAIFLLNALFRGGESASCDEARDINDDDGVELADVVFLLNALFVDGTIISTPFPDCGPDVVVDRFECESFSPCE